MTKKQIKDYIQSMPKTKNIFEAIDNYDIEAIKYHLKKNYINLNARNSHGKTILSELIRNYKNISEIAEIAEMLIDQGDVDINLRDINHDIITKQETLGLTPLMMACYRGNYKIAKKLIDKGAKIDIQEESRGITALMEAVESRSPEIVKLLIDSGADINIKNHNNETAIDYIRKRLEMAKKISSKSFNERRL